MNHVLATLDYDSGSYSSSREDEGGGGGVFGKLVLSRSDNKHQSTFGGAADEESGRNENYREG